MMISSDGAGLTRVEGGTDGMRGGGPPPNGLADGGDMAEYGNDSADGYPPPCMGLIPCEKCSRGAGVVLKGLRKVELGD